MAKTLIGCLTAAAAVAVLSLAGAGTASAAGWSGDSDAVRCVRLVQGAQDSSSEKNSLDDVADALSSPACRSVSSSR